MKRLEDRVAIVTGAAQGIGHAIADVLVNPTETRERLCLGVYRTLEPNNPLGLLQEALTLAMQAEPLEKRIRVDGQKTGRVTALDLPGQIQEALAAGIITENEAAVLREYDRKVMNLVHVDDFDPRELAAAAPPPGDAAEARMSVA